MIDMNFILAGRAVFIVSNNKGDKYRFKIYKRKSGDVYFASVYCGEWKYMGALNTRSAFVYKGHRGMSSEAKSVKVLNWALSVINGKNTLPDGYNIQHEGKCGRCGRPLTDLVSIRTGLGPVCRDK